MLDSGGVTAPPISISWQDTSLRLPFLKFCGELLSFALYSTLYWSCPDGSVAKAASKEARVTWSDSFPLHPKTKRTPCSDGGFRFCLSAANVMAVTAAATIANKATIFQRRDMVFIGVPV